jgi:hypothetical protein
MMPSPERLMDLAVVSVPGTAWELVDFGMNNVPRSAYTDAAIRLIKAGQLPDGSWSSNESRRPPMNAGDFQAAAVCIYALKHYGPSGEPATDQAVAKAVSWLERVRPETTQDTAFQAMGLAWASGASEAATKAAQRLAALQRADGGWSQFAGLESDAYATGQALYALNISGSAPATSAVYRDQYCLRRRRLTAHGTSSRGRSGCSRISGAAFRRPGPIHLDSRSGLGVDGAGGRRADAQHATLVRLPRACPSP